MPERVAGVGAWNGNHEQPLGLAVRDDDLRVVRVSVPLERDRVASVWRVSNSTNTHPDCASWPEAAPVACPGFSDGDPPRIAPGGLVAPLNSCRAGIP